MLIDRPERIAFNPDEAMVLLEHRNLKSEYNKYLEIFREFVETMEKIEIQGAVNTTAFARLQKLIREAKNVTEFVKILATDYSPSIDKKLDEIEGIETEKRNQVNRSMFSQESEEKILKHIKGNWSIK